MARRWIQKAIRRPGALHRALGVPKGQKIPEAKLQAAASRAKREHNSRLLRQVRLAQTLKRLRKK